MNAPREVRSRRRPVLYNLGIVAESKHTAGDGALPAMLAKESPREPNVQEIHLLDIRSIFTRY